ncbi:MAG: hypothetical protein JWN37_686 [Candidatus Nomurabacteria bacterium]|nr:hypothetical protein [Candidatus Nomurabacteria bacterium]
MEKIEQTTREISEKVMSAIRTGGILPHSRWYFIIRNIIYAAFVLVLLLAILYLSSFILFALQASGFTLLSGSKFFGIMTILNSLPWVLLLLVIIGIVSTLLLSRSAAFTYRTPTLYVFLGIIILVIAVSAIVSSFDLHKKIYERGHNFKPIKSLYEGFADPEMHNGIAGEIQSIDDRNIFIITPRNESFEVIVSSSTEIMSSDGLTVNDKVFIQGVRKEKTIMADIVKEINEQERNMLFNKSYDRAPNNPSMQIK